MRSGIQIFLRFFTVTVLVVTGLVVSSNVYAIPSDLNLVRVGSAGAFNAPIAIRAPRDGSGRIFVAEQSGTIKIVKNGTVLATPFLDLGSAVSFGGEQGLLGLAFHPNYAGSGTGAGVFYVAYTDANSSTGGSEDQVIARYTVSGDPDVANPTGTIVMRIPDICSNHNGGDIHFGPDGYLYWSMGDGGVQGDPNGFAQDLWKKVSTNGGGCTSPGKTYYLLGKILRIDVDTPTASASANMCAATTGNPAEYSIPASNPFAIQGNHCAEIWSYGFRNPFRFSFDRQTGAMLIADVGQNTYEEVSYEATATSGSNYEWNSCEALHTYPGGIMPCVLTGGVAPRIEYPHTASGQPSRCSIIGGYVFRGPIQQFQGTYVFGDYCSGEIFFAASPNPVLATWSFTPWAGHTFPGGVYGFGEDEAGNLYLADALNGDVWKFSSEFIFSDGFGN